MASDIDKQAGLERRRRSSGKRAGRVKVGHDKMGRTKYRPVGGARSRTRPAGFTKANSRGRRAESRYPNLDALRALEHAQHVTRAMAMGLDRGEAEAHARRDEMDGRRGLRARRPSPSSF